MQQWLKDTERQLLASKALGGLPDTAHEQLDTHLVHTIRLTNIVINTFV